MRISDWSSDVCSSDLPCRELQAHAVGVEEIDRADIDVVVHFGRRLGRRIVVVQDRRDLDALVDQPLVIFVELFGADVDRDMVHRTMRRHEAAPGWQCRGGRDARRRFGRSEEHTSELQSLMRISYAVFCLKKKIYP